MKTKKNKLRIIIALCIIAILAIVAIPGCTSIAGSMLCTLIACIMSRYMHRLDKLNTQNTNQ